MEGIITLGSMLFEKKNQLLIVVAALATVGLVAVYLKPLQKLVSAPFPVDKPTKPVTL